MLGFPSFDLPPGYQFDASSLLSSLSNVDPALTLLAPERPETPEPTFELLLTLTQPSKSVRTQNRKTKTKKTEPEKRGPFNIPLNIKWNAFLRMMAEEIGIEHSDLLVATFEWHWLRPASSPWLPVRDENGFASMVKKVKAKCEVKAETYVMFHMDALGKSRLSALSGNAQDVEEEIDLEEPVAKKVRCIPNLTVYSIQSLADEAGQCA